MNSVGKGVIKKDAMALVTGQPVYCDDLAPKDCLIVKLLRSPHAYAKIRSIDTSIAKRNLRKISAQCRKRKRALVLRQFSVAKDFSKFNL